MERNNTYFGKVVINDDPERIGRCKVKVLGVFDELQDNDLPWAFPAYNMAFAGGESKGYGSISVPNFVCLTGLSLGSVSINVDLPAPGLPVINVIVLFSLGEILSNSFVK